MSLSRRLDAHRQAVTSAQADTPLPKTNPPRPKDEEDVLQPESIKKDEEINMTKEEHEAAVAKATAEGIATGISQANDRNDAVMASEHYSGREPLAKTLLATGLSAAEITAALATAPKIEATALNLAEVEEKSEAAATAVMREAIASNVNSAINVSDGASATGASTDTGKIDLAADLRAFGGAQLAVKS